MRRVREEVLAPGAHESRVAAAAAAAAPALDLVAMAFPAAATADPVRDQLMKAFSMLDTDDTGSLGMKEITRLMNKLLNRKMDEMQIAEIMSEICDSDAPGVTIDFERFLASLRPAMEGSEEDLAKKAFLAMDADKSGILEARELSSLMSHVAGQKLTTSQVESVLQISSSGDGKVKLDDYMKVSKDP